MRLHTLVLVLSTVVAAAVGCKKADNNKPATTAGVAAGSNAPPVASAGSAASAASAGSAGSAGVAADSGSATVAAGSGSAAVMPPGGHRGGNCPSLVATSKTILEDKDGGLTLVISSVNRDAVATIQRRAKALMETRLKDHKGSDHNQQGTNGGGMGTCPVVGTMDAKATDTSDGVRIGLVPKANVRLDMVAVKADINDRIAKSAAIVAALPAVADGKGHGGGVGGGDGNDGGNHTGQGDGKGKTRDAGSATTK
jgi:hypothetical protein